MGNQVNYKSDRPCVACGHSADNEVCSHHVQTRAAGGTDHPFNLMPLCSTHHTEIHRAGTASTARKYAGVLKWLRDNHWALSSWGKWIGPSETRKHTRRDHRALGED